MNSNAFPARLAARASLAGIWIGPDLTAQLEAYYELLSRWNSSINLTSLSLEPLSDQAIDRLFVEPLSAIRIFKTDAPTWFDLGSGGGSPAIPMKLAKPAAQLTMVESRERKAAFLREAVRVLRIEKTVVEAERVESIAALHPLAGFVDVVTVRALRIDSALFQAIQVLLTYGGKVILFGGNANLAVPAGLQVVENPAISGAASHSDIVVLERTG